MEEIKKQIEREYDIAIDSLRKREDFAEGLEYFLQALYSGICPQEFRQKFNKPLVGLSCIQVPLELFDALGFHAFRMRCGSLSSHRLVSSHLPSLACPAIKSCLSSFYMDKSLEKLCDLIVMPTTCDWVVKLPEMTGLEAKSLHIMELPHTKDSERGRKRWIEEVFELKKVLENRSGQRLSPSRLRVSIKKYIDAWQVFGRLIEMRREGCISGTWSIVLANAFMLDNVDSWTEKTQAFLQNFDRIEKQDKPAVFLAGAPIFFPHLKVPELIEESGMFIAADELCTSERILTGAPVYDDASEYGLLKALAEKYYLSCACPVFSDNHRRIKNIIETMRRYNIKGVIYHLLKGCHPYDMESFHFEKAAKENGFHFLKIETDYSEGDRKNIMVRLEAFREMLR